MGSVQNTLNFFISDLILFFFVKIVSCEYLMLQISILLSLICAIIPHFLIVVFTLSVC